MGIVEDIYHDLIPDFWHVDEALDIEHAHEVLDNLVTKFRSVESACHFDKNNMKFKEISRKQGFLLEMAENAMHHPWELFYAYQDLFYGRLYMEPKDVGFARGEMFGILTGLRLYSN
mmetsp:Transcript_1707/g.1502  ORF Transcript_1707/g.1502 Transcript_1707/m.1502 type:complete len:117 (+) Transcript_1707:383-733(+)